MANKWSEFFSLEPDEKIIAEYNDCQIFKRDRINTLQGSLILTNKRLIGIKAKYEGLITKKFVNFETLLFQSPLEDISNIEFGNIDTWITIGDPSIYTSC